MGIIGSDASKMAQPGRAGDPRLGPAGRALCFAKPPFDNEIARFQSVLRHFLTEIPGVGLGKS
jgi:hypothetical protein